MGASIDNGLSDVSYDGGLGDNVWDYSGDSTLQDVTAGSDTLGLDSNYDSQASVYDQMESFDPESAQFLSGASDTPWGSAYYSTPTPNAQPPSDSTWSGLSALSKFGSSFAALFANHSTSVQPGYYPQQNQPGGPVPTVNHQPVSGQTVLVLVIIGVAIVVLLSAGGVEE